MSYQTALTYIHFFNHSLDLLCIAGFDGYFKQLNPAWQQTLGFSIEELLAQPSIEFVHPDDREATLAEIRKLTSGMETITFENRYRCKDGSYKWLSWSSSISKEDELLLAVARDITTRKQVEQQLNESKEQYRITFEKAAVGIAHVRPDGRWLWVNQRLCDMLGYTRTELLALTFQEITHPHDLEHNRQLLQRILAGELESCTIEKRYIRKNSSPIWVNLTVSLVRGPSGAPNYFISVVEDITQRKQTEKQLQRRDAILDAVSFAATCFLRSASWEEEIDRVLERLGQATDISRAYIFKNHTAQDKTLLASQRAEWVAPGIEPQINNPQLQNVSWEEAGLARWIEILRQGQKVCGNISAFLPGEQEILISQNIKSILVIPIFVNQNWWGFIGFDECQIEREWSPVEIEALTTAANTLGAAIQQKHTAHENYRRSRELGLLYQIIATSAANPEPEAILEVACHQLAQTFELSQAAAVLLDSKKSTGTIVAEYRSRGQPSLLGEIININDNLLAQHLVATKSPLAITDVESDPYAASIRELLRRRSTVSLLMLPLIIGEDVVGSLSLGARQKRIFSTEEINLAWSVAGQVAGALARSNLIQTQRHLSMAIEQVAESIIITDLGGVILYVNPAFERITGYHRTEVLGQNPRLLKSNLHDDTFYRDMWATISQGQTWRGRMTNRKKDGSLYTEQTTITPVRSQDGTIAHYIAVKQDVTQDIQREERLQQSQRMEAIGRLAGGIAHDFNNLLTVITGYIELLLQEAARENDPHYYDLGQIKKAAERAGGLTRQLLTFSRKQAMQPQVLNINYILNDIHKMLERLIGEDIRLETILTPHLGQVKADESQIEQIVMNLVINARDAMPDGGSLTIETVNVELDQMYAQQHIGVTPGPYIMFAISDTGFGMSKETQALIFEPFFTTKPQDEGTGLGLATVYGIVKQSGGHIWVYSEIGQGSTFKIYLPRIDTENLPNTTASTSRLVSPGNENVLLVEDEELVRTLASKMLEANGYRAIAARSGTEAIEYCQTHQEPIHLLITDVIMSGGMNGRQLAQTLTRFYPKLKVLYISGYTSNGILRQAMLEENAAFLQKPFSFEVFTRKVRDVLDKP